MQADFSSKVDLAAKSACRFRCEHPSSKLECQQDNDITCCTEQEDVVLSSLLQCFFLFFFKPNAPCNLSLRLFCFQPREIVLALNVCQCAFACWVAQKTVQIFFFEFESDILQRIYIKIAWRIQQVFPRYKKKQTVPPHLIYIKYYVIITTIII